MDKKFRVKYMVEEVFPRTRMGFGDTLKGGVTGFVTYPYSRPKPVDPNLKSPIDPLELVR